jgi:hypothetical protein
MPERDEWRKELRSLDVAVYAAIAATPTPWLDRVQRVAAGQPGDRGGARGQRGRVEKHVTGIFQKLGIGPSTTEHRRVLAVLTYMRDANA